MKNLILLMFVLVAFSTPAIAMRAVDVKNGLDELSEIEKAISVLGHMWCKVENNYMISDYVMLTNASDDRGSCNAKCKALLNEAGFFKALNKVNEVLQDKKKSLTIGE